MSNPAIFTILPNAFYDGSQGGQLSIEDVVNMARRSEEVGVDGFFLADSLAFDVSFSRYNGFEPLTLAAAILARTERIVVIVTLSTTFTHPYNVARYLTSLSHIGHGRIGVNLVTSFDGERNFGLPDLPAPEERYDRAGEFIDVVQQLERSWGTNQDSWTEIGFSGKYFNVQGPLSSKPYPSPILVGQSGSSPPGIGLAARVADFVFTAGQVNHIQWRYFEALKDQCMKTRSDNTRPTILTGLAPIIGDTAKEAEEYERELTGVLPFEEQLHRLEEVLGIDLSDVDPKDDFPKKRLLPIEDVVRRQGRAADIYEIIERNDLTLAELVRTQNRSNGHRTVVGTADQVAKEIGQIADAGFTDGFIVLLPKLANVADKVFTELIPRLERNGHLTPSSGADEARSRFLRRV